MALIKCKECGNEISSSAKKCPRCGKDQRGFFMKHKILSAILILIVWYIAATAMSGGSEDSAGPAQVKVATAAKVGDSLKSGGYEITITSVEEKTRVGGDYINEEPSTGGVFIIVNHSLKNISDKPIGAINRPSYYLQDGNGTNYDPDISASSVYATEHELNGKIYSDLNPGLTIEGVDVFEIAKDLYDDGGWKIYIDADDDLYVQVKESSFN